MNRAATATALRALVAELQPAAVHGGALAAAAAPGPGSLLGGTPGAPWDIRQELGPADRVVMLSRPLERHASVRAQPSASDKPTGLLYALGPTWLDWCREVLPHFERALHYKLTLDRSRLLVINSDAELDAFTREFKVVGERFDHLIDWRRVAASGFGGIEVAPYFGTAEGRRVTWAYSWDVPSGVVWDDAVILAAEPVPRQTPFVAPAPPAQDSED